MKFAIITNIPTPYRTPLFNEISNQLVEEGGDLHVIFAAKTYARRKFKVNETEWAFKYSYLDSKPVTLGTDEKTTFLYGNLGATLSRIKPDKIIVAGFSTATIKVMLWCVFRATPFYIWTGSVAHTKRNPGAIKTIARKIMSKFCKGFIVYSTKTKDYLMNLGVAAEKITISYNTVEVSFFVNETNKHRIDLAPSNRKVLTYLGYLNDRKQVDHLIHCINELKKTRSDFVLEIMGDGATKTELEKLVLELDLQDNVDFLGYIDTKDLPPYLARSSCFLFQTGYDIWGLVLNEAMAAGIPCLASVNAGATADLIIEGETGFAVDFSNYESVVEKINWVLNNPKEAEVMASNARNRIQKEFSIDKGATSFINAVTD